MRPESIDNNLSYRDRMISFGFLFFFLCVLRRNGYAASADLRPETKIYYDIIDLVPESVLDTKMKQSFRDVVQFADKIFSRIDKPSTHPLPINLALLRLYALQTQLQSIPSHNATASRQPEVYLPAQVSEEFVAESLHFYRFAIAVYNAKPGIIQQDIMLNNLEDKETSNIKMPRHIVFLDHVTKSIVISIRGTASVSDMLTDLYIEPYPFLEPSRNLFAHHGMAESAETLLPLVTAAIHEIRQRSFSTDINPKSNTLAKLLNRKAGKLYKYKNYRVIVTGHSLGAGTASLLAMLLSTQSNITATAFAYAPPPVVSSTQYQSPLASATWRLPFKLPFLKRSKPSSYHIHSFVHNNDIISRSSHTQILSLVSALAAVDQLPWGALDRMGILFRNILSEEEKESIHQALLYRKHFHEGNDHELYVPGDIYLLRPYVPGSNAVSAARRDLHTTAEEVHATNTSHTADSHSTDVLKNSNNSSSHKPMARSATTTTTSTTTTTTTSSITTSSTTTSNSEKEATFELFGTSILAPKLPDFPDFPDLPSFPELPPLPPQLLEALQNLLGPASNHTIVHTTTSTSTSHAPSATASTPGSDAQNMDTFRTQNSVPSQNVTHVTPGAAKNSPLSSFYRCVKVRDPGSLFNGLMYYGDGMVADHLTIPFEKALLLLTSSNVN